MQLRLLWWSLVEQLRPACTRTRTFCCLAISLAALSVRSDLQGGVSSCVRALGLKSRTYLRLLAFFHSSALCPDQLARVWTALVLRVHPGVHRVSGFLVVLADGLKKAKCGRKMPGVKSLHQVCDQNTKPEFIMGHSCQALALLCRVAGSFQARGPVRFAPASTKDSSAPTATAAPSSTNSCCCCKACVCPNRSCWPVGGRCLLRLW